MAAIVRDRDPAAVRRILTALPDWFGDPEALEGYVADAADPGFAALLATEGAEVAGVALVRRHFPETAELHLIAVTPDRHGRGIGRALVEAAAADAAADGASFLTVHTVGPSFTDEGYAATRAFYRAVGFLPLEEHEGLGWWGPTLVSVRPLR